MRRIVLFLVAALTLVAATSVEAYPPSRDQMPTPILPMNVYRIEVGDTDYDTALQILRNNRDKFEVSKNAKNGLQVIDVTPTPDFNFNGYSVRSIRFFFDPKFYNICVEALVAFQFTNVNAAEKFVASAFTLLDKNYGTFKQYYHDVPEYMQDIYWINFYKHYDRPNPIVLMHFAIVNK